MNKDDFFTDFHLKLAKKYNVGPNSIHFIRDRILGGKLTAGKMIEKAKEKYNKTKSFKTKMIYNEVIDLAKKLTANEFNDLLVKTKFDK